MITTGQNPESIRQQIYDAALQESYDEALLGLAIFNDMTSMFTDGDTLNVGQIGQVTLQDYSEDSPIDFSAIDTSRITLSVSEYVQDGFYMTDKEKQDSHIADLLFAKRVKRSVEAFKKRMESDVYAACNSVQTPADPNTINGQAHRAALAGAATAQDVVNAINDARLAFDKASVPEDGRIMIVDPTVAHKLGELGTGAVLVADSPRFEGLLETGFSRNNRFVRNIHGFDVYVSNLLPEIASETVSGTAVTSGVANIGMCIVDDDAKPIMGVMRQRPESEQERNVKMKRDEYSATARWGFAAYRPESLYCLLTQF